MPPAASIVQTAYGPVEYHAAGSGEPVLYFHGSGVTGETMLAVESPLVEDGFRLIVPNRPGYGRTPLATQTSATDCARVAAALLDSLGVAAAHVMGSSGGAAFAASFAVHHAYRARSLVLLCPQLHRWDHKRWLPAGSRWTLPWLTRPLLRKLLLCLYRLQLPRMSARQFLKMEAGDRYPDIANNPAALSLCTLTLAAFAQATRHAGFENDFRVFTSEDVLDPDRPLETPALVIHDPSDPVAPVDHVDWFVAQVPRCERVSVHAAGHLIWVGPDAAVVHERRVRFLQEHTAERHGQ